MAGKLSDKMRAYYKKAGKTDAEIAAIRKSLTWRIGSLVLTPVRWVKRSKS